MVIWLPYDLDTCLIRSRTFGVVLICLSTCIMCLWHTLLFWICFLVNCFVVSAPRRLAPSFPFSFTPNNLSIFMGYAVVSWIHFWWSGYEDVVMLWFWECNGFIWLVLSRLVTMALKPVHMNQCCCPTTQYAGDLVFFYLQSQSEEQPS